MDMKLELVPVPVTDIDRAKAFYVEKVGFHADLDIRPTETVRIVQLTPPGSACSIVLSIGLDGIKMQPGSLRGLHLVVGDVSKAREALISPGVGATSQRTRGYWWRLTPESRYCQTQRHQARLRAGW